MKKSRVYKVGKHSFRYDYDNHVVECVEKADKEMLKDNEEWQKKYGKNLWDIDELGYVEFFSAGLMLENWKNQEARREYLEEWAAELDYEARCLAADFVKYELPKYQNA